MAEAAPTNREEPGRERAFSLPEPVEKLSSYPKRLRNYLHDVRLEMKAVNWPSRTDVWSTTLVVTVTVAFFGVYFLLTDSTAQRIISWLIDFGKHH